MALKRAWRSFYYWFLIVYSLLTFFVSFVLFVLSIQYQYVPGLISGAAICGLVSSILYVVMSEV